MLNQAHRVSLVGTKQIEAAGAVLAEALADDPLCIYTQPDVEARLRQFAWYFAEIVRHGVEQRASFCHIDLGRPDGIAVWQPPHANDPAADQEGLRRRFGPEAYERLTAYRHFEHVRSQSMAGRPHWYLSIVGVDPSSQGQGIGAALLTPGLQLADEQGLPCYLETFVSDNVLFYEHRGFEVIAAGVHLESRIPIWAMKREPND